MPKILRLYVERIPADRLLGPRFDEFWREFPRRVEARGWSGQLELVVRVTLVGPGKPVCRDASRLVLERAGLPVRRVWLWGQHWDRERVFLNRTTVDGIFDGWRRLLAGLGTNAQQVEGLFFDLEPNLGDLLRLREHPASLGRLVGRGLAAGTGSREVRAHLAELRRLSGAPILAACVPTGPEWLSLLVERALGTPVSRAADPIWPELTVMDYTSFALPLLEVLGAERAWSVAGQIAGRIATAHARRWRHTPTRTSAICGTNCIGILGDEPSFSGPEAMAPTLRTVARTEPYALGIFNLSGIVYGPEGGRGDPDRELWSRWGDVLSRVLAEG